MGNTTTKEKSDHVDGGTLLPNGIYSTPQDYDFRIVQRLIHQRRLAPFYKGLEEWDDSEDALEERAAAASAAGTTASNTTTTPQQHQQPPRGHAHSNSHSSTSHGHTRGNSSSQHPTERSMADSEREMRRLYQGAIECPICFLYYPRNINRTRCCDKPMCTECFVQLKRLESAPTESPACPYCVEPHFGVIYSPALLPGGLPPGSPIPGHMASTMSSSPSSSSLDRGADSQSPSSPSTRRRSTSHKSPEVVAADDLRPDWNRRILAAVQRQPGSRRASTSSSANSTFALGRRLAVGRQGSNSRRSNSTAAAQEYNGYLSAMRNMGTDLEELMIMEAMRQSLQDEEERLAREAAASNTAGAGGAGGSDAAAASGGQGSSPSSPSQQGRGHSQGQRQGTRGAGRNGEATRVGGGPSLSATGHSRSSTLSSTAHGGSTSAVPALAPNRSDNDSLESMSGRDDDSDSDQEDSPALLDNRAIRYAQVNLPGRTTVVAGGGGNAVAGREGSDLPKHHRHAEGAGSRNASEAV
ncbi:SNF1-interacting protein [Linnemannia zychae]|nr:SNF1-interacting protein [Linnemannia zychae]